MHCDGIWWTIAVVGTTNQVIDMNTTIGNRQNLYFDVEMQIFLDDTWDFVGVPGKTNNM